MRLSDLLKPATKVIEPPKPDPNAPQPKEGEVKTEPNTPKEIPVNYEEIGEANAAMFAMGIEAPLLALNGIMTRVRKRKIKKEFGKDPVELDKALKRLKEGYDENKDIIEIDDKEYTSLKRAYVALAKLNKSSESSPSVMLFTAITSILVRRAEIMFD